MYRDIYGFTYEGFTATDIANLIKQSQDIVQFYDQFTQQITQKIGYLKDRLKVSKAHLLSDR